MSGTCRRRAEPRVQEHGPREQLQLDGRGGGQRGAVQLWQAGARMEVKLGRRTSAVRLYERGCKLFPEDVQLHLSHAKLHADLGSEAEARALFARELSRPRPHPYAFQSAAALEALGKPRAASSLYYRAVEADEKLYAQCTPRIQRCREASVARTREQASRALVAVDDEADDMSPLAPVPRPPPAAAPAEAVGDRI